MAKTYFVMFRSTVKKTERHLKHSSRLMSRVVEASDTFVFKIIKYNVQKLTTTVSKTHRRAPHFLKCMKCFVESENALSDIGLCSIREKLISCFNKLMSCEKIILIFNFKIDVLIGLINVI
jgi:hypothetical protein